MPMQDLAAVRPLETLEDLVESRLEAIGFIFHGTAPQASIKRVAVKNGTNLLHFARCAKLDKVSEEQIKIWFRTIRIAKKHLDETVGSNRWKWCKLCEREITQKILNEQ